eukprot:5428080-Pleurochrysis_carterae.AAC.1
MDGKNRSIEGLEDRLISMQYKKGARKILQSSDSHTGPEKPHFSHPVRTQRSNRLGTVHLHRGNSMLMNGIHIKQPLTAQDPLSNIQHLAPPT